MSIFATLALMTLSLTSSDPAAARKHAAERLQVGLAAAETATSPERRRALLENAAFDAADLLDSSRTATLLREEVDAARWRSVVKDPKADAILTRELASLADDLRFQPRMEADLPVGFPMPTPVHEIELKRYPGYRMASAATRGQSAFWKLFQHIEKNEIAMTAPVEMTYTAKGEALDESRMAFLYARPDLGATGDDSGVDVIDIAPMEVLSLGCRGNSTDKRIATARELLDDWLAQRPEYERAGELRVLGYNSPMVRGQRRTFEVQIPVRQVVSE